MRTTRRTITWLSAALLAACGGSGRTVEATQEAATQPAEQTTAAAAEPSVGHVSFTVDGEAKSFDYLPASYANYTPISSTVEFHAAAGSTELLTINFISIDLKEIEPPVDLPEPMAPDAGLADLRSAMATVGFIYAAPDGTEWAGPGTVHVESFDRDGTLTATFAEVTIPHTDEQLPDLTLSDGALEARITAPW